MVWAMATYFVEDLFNSLREKKVDLKSGVVVFVGGGGIRLKKVIEASGKIGKTLFVEDINANAKGDENISAYFFENAPLVLSKNTAIST